MFVSEVPVAAAALLVPTPVPVAASSMLAAVDHSHEQHLRWLCSRTHRETRSAAP